MICILSQVKLTYTPHANNIEVDFYVHVDSVNVD